MLTKPDESERSNPSPQPPPRSGEEEPKDRNLAPPLRFGEGVGGRGDFSASESLRPWTVLEREDLLAAPPWLRVIREAVQLPSGSVIPDFYRVELPDFALVVPVTPEGEFVLVRGYWHGVGRIQLSPPGGFLGDGEVPLAGAQRELMEETGYASKDWTPLGSYVVDANRNCGTMHAFLARGARPTRPVVVDEREELEICLLDRAAVALALKAGEVHGLAGACALSLALLAEW